MALRRHKSFPNFSTLLGRTARRNSHLIWICLASASKGPQYSDIIDSRTDSIVKALLNIEDIKSVTRLKNTSPACLLSNSTASSPRTSPVSLLVYTDGPDSEFRLTVTRVRHVLEDAEIIYQPHGNQVLNWSLSTYELTQSYQPWRSRHQTGQCLVSVSIEPSLGQDDDVDAWYRKEHLGMLSSKALFLRCNRYERFIDVLDENRSNSATAKFLALHEYTSVQDLFDHSVQKGQLVEETEWARRVLDNAKSVERTIWTVAERVSKDSG